MRCILLILVLLSASRAVHAQDSAPVSFKLASVLLDLGSSVPHQLDTTLPSPDAAPEDVRAFWFAAVGSGATALGTHIILGIPTLLLASWADEFAPSGPGSIALMLGIGGAYITAQTALAAWVGTLVFDTVSTSYDSSFLAAWSAHLLGTVAGVAVGALPIGLGLMLVGGIGNLAEFTGNEGANAIGIFSLLGALPALVLGGLAVVSVPALASSLAIAGSVRAAEGHAIFASRVAYARPALPFVPSRDGPAVSRGGLTIPLLTLPIPGA